MARKQDLPKHNVYFRSVVLNLTISSIRIRCSDPESVFCIQSGKKPCQSDFYRTAWWWVKNTSHLNSRTQSCMNRAASVCKYLISLQEIYQQTNQGNQIGILNLICFGTRSKLYLTTSTHETIWVTCTLCCIEDLITLFKSLLKYLAPWWCIGHLSGSPRKPSLRLHRTSWITVQKDDFWGFYYSNT